MPEAETDSLRRLASRSGPGIKSSPITGARFHPRVVEKVILTCAWLMLHAAVPDACDDGVSWSNGL
jgi:hypothetical protein